MLIKPTTALRNLEHLLLTRNHDNLPPRPSPDALPDSSSREDRILAKSPPFLDRLSFGVISEGLISHHQAVEFVKHQSAQTGIPLTLWNIKDAVSSRINDSDPQNLLNLTTRTTALYFYQNGRYFIAFDDPTEIRQNVLLSLTIADQPLKFLPPPHEWTAPAHCVLSNQNPLVREALARAEKNDHLFLIPPEILVGCEPGNCMSWIDSRHPSNETFCFPVDSSNKMHQATAVQAILGRDLTPSYSKWLEGIPYLKHSGGIFSIGITLLSRHHFTILTTQFPTQRNSFPVVVLPVTLGGYHDLPDPPFSGEYFYGGAIYANAYFSSRFHARGAYPKGLSTGKTTIMMPIPPSTR